MNLNTRITMKFLLQIGLLVLAVWSIIGVALGFYFVSKRSSAAQTPGLDPAVLLKQMATATSVDGGRIQVSGRVLAEVKEGGGWIEILDDNGRAIYHFNLPTDVPKKYAPGLLVYDKLNPQTFGYQLSTWYGTVDHQSLTWLYGLPPSDSTRAHSHQPFLYIALLFGGSLCATIVAAYLFGRRMGAPVLHMMNWLQNLAAQSYTEPTDARGLPKSKRSANGELRRPYRMYRDVLATLDRLSTALQQSDADRQRLEQTREEWIAGITHDLRTPLSSVKGYADLCAAPDYAWTASEVREFGRVISEKATYIDGLIDDLGLTFRLRNHALPLQRKPENVTELVRHAVIDLVNHGQAEGKTVQFDSEAGETIYPLDAKWFTRAFDNLLNNALQHNPNGTTVSIDVQRMNIDGDRYSGVRIEIRDDGAGMDEDTVAHLFDRYFRGTNTAEHQVKGSGLGTAIAKQLIEAHGGHISVESTLGHGTTLVVELPPLHRGSL